MGKILTPTISKWFGNFTHARRYAPRLPDNMRERRNGFCFLQAIQRGGRVAWQCKDAGREHGIVATRCYGLLDGIERYLGGIVVMRQVAEEDIAHIRGDYLGDEPCRHGIVEMAVGSHDTGLQILGIYAVAAS